MAEDRDRPQPLAPEPARLLPAVRTDELVAEFLAGRRATTLRAYKKALKDYARFASTVAFAFFLT